MSTKKRGPLITFGTGGLLAAYYIGTISFIRDHFDLIKSDIAISGLSCGSFGAFIIFLELSLCQSMHYMFLLKDLFSNRTLKILFNSTSDYISKWYKLTTSFNITDDILSQQYSKFNSVYFGCSSIGFNNKQSTNSWSKYIPSLNPVLMGYPQKFTSIKEMMYAMTCSSRIVPFYRSFGKWRNNYLCFDGGVAHKLAVSEYDKKHREIISIAAFSDNGMYGMGHRHGEDTICPDPEKEIWSIADIVKYNCTLEEQLERYKIGYLAAGRCKYVLDMIKKGLVWKREDYDIDDIEDETKWNKHLNEMLEKNMDELREYFKDIDTGDGEDGRMKEKEKRANCCSMIYFFFLSFIVIVLIL